MLKKLNRYYIYLGLSIVGIIVMTVFCIWMPLQEIDESSKQLFLNNNKDIVWGLENKELDRFKENYDTYKSDLEKLSAVFVDANDPVDFIKFLEKTATDVGVSSDIVIIPPVAGALNASTMKLSISAKGNFSHMITFAERMEAGPYLVTVQSVTIARPSESNVKEKTTSQVQGIFLINVVTK